MCSNMKYLPSPHSPDARTVQKVWAEKPRMQLTATTASYKGELESMHRFIKLDKETGERKPCSKVIAEGELCHSHIQLLPL